MTLLFLYLRSPRSARCAPHQQPRCAPVPLVAHPGSRPLPHIAPGLAPCAHTDRASHASRTPRLATACAARPDSHLSPHTAQTARGFSHPAVPRRTLRPAPLLPACPSFCPCLPRRRTPRRAPMPHPIQAHPAHYARNVPPHTANVGCMPAARLRTQCLALHAAHAV
ncbi:hypothetical protein GGX14DRAFT_554241 [Mycena pura]|uniref:Uncharacterized protein n=1 Tax=Mycena pura TaxID=153505 RepID=A0AAD6YVV1_9AGAR|nr:hypothetical protein GGX14DRAFT_554241 [Mycena pura]